jgi:chromosome segregation ATPase
MKYKNIQSHVPQGEHFDESAIVNEGGFLSVNHLNAIESVLENNASTLSTAQQSLQTATENVTTLTTERDAAQSALSTANATVTSQANKIANLEAQIVEFGKKSSGNGSTIHTETDEVIEQPSTVKSDLPAYNSPDHPANMAAKRWVKGSVKTDK